jgi:hypothetical protein
VKGFYSSNQIYIISLMIVGGMQVISQDLPWFLQLRFGPARGLLKADTH